MDDALRELVDGWLAKADSDWKAADRLEPGHDETDYDPVYYDAAAFHLQQGAEPWRLGRALKQRSTPKRSTRRKPSGL